MFIRVFNGTNAGIRPPMSSRYPHDWVCPNCKARNKYYWRKCPGCGHPRPEEA